MVTLEERRKKKEEEERRRRKAAEATEAVGAIEKAASQQAAAAGLQVPTKRQREAAAAQVEQGVTTGAQVPVAQAQQARQEVTQQLSQAGAFEQVTPREVPLTPSEAPLQQFEEAPVIGPVSAALQNIFFQSEREGIVGGSVEQVPVVTPETAREMALTRIRERSFRKGISDRERFGTLVESIPVAGSLARKYAGGIIETPSANADNVIAEISKIKEAASTGQEKVRNGLEDPDYGLDRARQMEEDIAKLEGRLQLLINSSPILRSNTDEINKIQEEILEAREKVNRYRTAASFGLTAQLSGTGRVIPTDEQLFLELKGGR